MLGQDGAAEVVQVVVDVPRADYYSYLAPVGSALPGCRVKVPFGPRNVVGVVWQLGATPSAAPASLKAILSVLDTRPILSESIRDLLGRCAQYYHLALGPTVFTAIPSRLRNAAPLPTPGVLLWTLSASGRQAMAGLPVKAHLQCRLAQSLAEGPQLAAWLTSMGTSAAHIVRTWCVAGWIVPASKAVGAADVSGPTLTHTQAQIWPAISQHKGVMLLFGVTGSGKTELYLRRMAEVLAAGQQVLYLVPEIHLTPQLLAQIQSRFPGRSLATLTSAVADGERAQAWLAAGRGELDIVVGTRLSVFTPIPKLGLIVVDEEHDASFKQQEGLRYSARDVAVLRGSVENVPVLLGSATPSLETWHNVSLGRYASVHLNSRAIAQTPLQFQCVDQRRYRPVDGLTEPLISALRETVARGEQGMVFINRRGYAPVLYCDACAWAAACPNCSTRLVLHAQSNILVCHHCGRRENIPAHCPSCRNADLVLIGAGTQRVEAALARALPQARILRVDRDSMRRKGSFSVAREQIHAGEVDILVGTQMLSKGHDFANLTLVGILNADASLYSADFRAGERLFSQLLQVAGRAGRAGKAGQVLLQTGQPDHPLYQAVSRQDYVGFARGELATRAQAAFPPFAYQAVLRVESNTEEALWRYLNTAYQQAEPMAKNVEVFPPIPASISRKQQRFRAQVLIQAQERPRLHQFLKDWLPGLPPRPTGGVRWVMEVDPLEV